MAAAITAIPLKTAAGIESFMTRPPSFTKIKYREIVAPNKASMWHVPNLQIQRVVGKAQQRLKNTIPPDLHAWLKLGDALNKAT